MSLILVNPSLVWEIGDRRVSYFDIFRKASDNAWNHASLPAEHLGLASIQAYCEQQGLSAHVINGMLLNHTSAEQTFAAIEEVARAEGDPTLIGFSGTSLVFPSTLALARMCTRRWPNVRTIIGYDFGTLNYERVLRDYPEIHFVCRGDGEAVFATLAERLGAHRSYEDIPGLAWRDAAGTVHANDPVALDIDALPWPTRHQLPQVLAMGFAAGVSASRGCPYRCSYCTVGETSALLGKQAYRTRSVDALVDEMAKIKHDFDLRHITIVDDLFMTRAPSSRERAARFAEELLRRNVNIEWMVDIRVDSIEPELYKLLHRAGLRRVFVGVESGSPDQLQAYNKRYLIKQDTPLGRLRALQDIGITVIPGIIMFHPKVTPGELRATLDILDQLDWRAHWNLYMQAKPYPGTALQREWEEQGVTTGTWPIQMWEFADERAKTMHAAVVWAASQPGASYEDVRAEFVRHLTAWERGEAVKDSQYGSPMRAAFLQHEGAA